MNTMHYLIVYIFALALLLFLTLKEKPVEFCLHGETHLDYNKVFYKKINSQGNTIKCNGEKLK